MGLSFTLNDGTHYGWMQISVSDGDPNAVVHSWAYNLTPGESIPAGVVPEPATGALLLAGAATFAARRQWKRR